MTPTRTELAYDILMKLLEKDKVYPFTIASEAFAMADEFLEEVKRHDSGDEVVFDECVHMHTTLFNGNGIGKCFDCGKKVNMDREIVEHFHKK